MEPKSRLALFDTVVVCPGAYDAFVMEKNLHDQEKIFAKTLMNMSMPALSERYADIGVSPLAPLAFSTDHMSTAYVRCNSVKLLIIFDDAVALSSRRMLPPSGSAKMTTRLLLMGMFVEFVKLESAEGGC